MLAFSIFLNRAASSFDDERHEVPKVVTYRDRCSGAVFTVRSLAFEM